VSEYLPALDAFYCSPVHDDELGPDGERPRWYLSPTTALTDRLAACEHAWAAYDANYEGDELATSWREAEHDLARMELINGRRTWAAFPSPLAVAVRKATALHYRRQARAVARLLSASDVWDDRDLLSIITQGRRSVTSALARETDELRRLVLELVLSILDDLVRALVESTLTLEIENAPSTHERALHRHRRRRAGPCLHRPRLVHARRADDPHLPRREHSHPYGAHESRMSSIPGGSH